MQTPLFQDTLLGLLCRYPRDHRERFLVRKSIARALETFEAETFEASPGHSL